MNRCLATFILLAAGIACAQPAPQATGGIPNREDKAHSIKRVMVGGKVASAKLISQVAPVYPLLAKQARISGTVRLHVIVARDGSMAQIEVASGHPLLVQSALDAVRQWRYQPTLLNGEPVEVDTFVEVVFQLSDNPLPGKDDAPQTEPPTLTAVDPATAKDIRRLVEATGAKKLGTQLAEPFLRVAREKLLAGLPPGENREKIAQRFFEKITASLASDDFQDVFVSVYAKHFTHEEIIGLLSFYESPLGKRLLEETPAFLQELQTASGTRWAQDIFPRVVRELAQEFPELAKLKPGS